MKTPAMKLHKSGQGYVYWEGKCRYFGKYGTLQAEEKYRQWILGLFGNKSESTTTSPLVSDLFAEYAKAHPRVDLLDKLKAVRDLGPLSGHRCHEFTPLVYRTLRARLVATGTKCASYVNDLMRLVQRIFRWGVSMEMAGIDIYERLKTVAPLKPHEVARQSKKRQPAKRDDVLKTLVELHPIQADMVRLILFTGARPGEICSMMVNEVSKAGPKGTWVYRPDKHKTAHHGKRKYIVFGPQGIEILKRHWPAKGRYFFPAVLKVGYYEPDSLYQAVQHACERAGVPRWSPYQLRHLRMTELTVDKGLEIAASVAGHGETTTTALYQHEPDVLELKRAI